MSGGLLGDHDTYVVGRWETYQGPRTLVSGLGLEDVRCLPVVSVK